MKALNLHPYAAVGRERSTRGTFSRCTGLTLQVLNLTVDLARLPKEVLV